MLQYFQSAYLNRYLVLFTLALICWLPNLFLAPSWHHDPGAVFHIPKIEGISYYVVLAIAFTVTATAALLTNYIASDSGFSNKISTIGLMIFVLYSSSLVSFTSIQAFVLINLFLVFFVRLVFYIPESQTMPFLSFNAALLVGVASLFFIPVAYFIVLLWIALLIHRAADIRNILTATLGLLTPWLFAFLYFFWFDRLGDYFKILAEIVEINPGFLLSFDLLTYIILAIFMLLTLVSAFQATTKLTEKNINHRRNLIITLHFLVITTAIVVLYGKVSSSFLLLALPLTFVVTQSLKETSRKRFYNILLFTLALLIVANHYIHLLI
jgi:hypothetical protein